MQHTCDHQEFESLGRILLTGAGLWAALYLAMFLIG